MTAVNIEGAAAAAAAPDPDEAQRAIEYCYEQGWSDGLPLVPVSKPLLDAFLATTGKDPDEILGALEQVGRDVNVRTAAINAAMAGCKPEYFPVSSPRSRRSCASAPRAAAASSRPAARPR